MSEAAARQRKSELARIHIGKMQLFDDDGDCRAMLESVAGVRSAADLDGARRRVVLEHLKACRAEFRPAQESGLRRNATASPGLGERAALLAGVDRSAMTGRRDYAMLQPAATYGLRSGLAGLTVAGREDREHPSVASGTGERASVNRGPGSGCFRCAAKAERSRAGIDSGIRGCMPRSVGRLLASPLRP